MERSRRRTSVVVADYIETVLEITRWSQAELARRLEVPESRVSFLLGRKARKGHYGVAHQSVSVPFLFEIEEISGVRLKIAAAPDSRGKPALQLVRP